MPVRKKAMENHLRAVRVVRRILVKQMEMRQRAVRMMEVGERAIRAAMIPMITTMMMELRQMALR